MKRTVVVVMALLLSGFMVFAGGGSEESSEESSGGVQQVTQLEWAAGSVGGGWYLMSAGIVQLIEENAPNIKIRVVPGGGTQNSFTVGDNKTEIGFGMNNLVMDASNGRDPYDKPYDDIRAIANGFSFNYYHFLAAEDTGIKTFDDFMNYQKNIRIDVTKKGSSGEDIFRKILGYFQTSYEDMEAKGAKIFFNEYSSITTNIKDKHIDFTGINIAPPASIIQELSLGRKLRVIPLPEDLRDFMNSEYGYGKAVIKKSMYPDLLTDDIPTITTGTMAMCHASVDEEVVYQITKILCENPSKLANIANSLKDWNPADAWKDMPVPLHPGAERYYREKGYLK